MFAKKNVFLHKNFGHSWFNQLCLLKGSRNTSDVLWTLRDGVGCSFPSPLRQKRVRLRGVHLPRELERAWSACTFSRLPVGAAAVGLVACHHPQRRRSFL